MKNIVFVMKSLAPSNGGIEKVTHQLVKGLSTEDIKCYFVYYDADFSGYDIDRKIKIDIDGDYTVLKDVFFNFLKTKEIDVIINQDLYHKNTLKLYKEVKSTKQCSIVSCFHLSPDYYRFQRIKSPLFAIKNVIWKLLFKRDIRTNRIRAQFYLSDKFVLLSDSFVEDFTRIYGVKDVDKLDSIPNPLSFHKDYLSLGVPNKEKMVLIVSRLHEEQKNIKAALRIWKSIEQHGIVDWKLCLVGHGEDEEKILAYAQMLNLRNFFFEGRKEDPSSYFERASIFLMTSRYEGFGITLIEAQQCGCVPIAFDSFCSIKDIIQDGFNGILVDCLKENIYTQQLRKLIQDNELRHYLSNNALNTSRKFEIANIKSRWTELIGNLTN
ncbi:glycosyltransferase [Sphingobacterium multivorum]|uniref:glycosyltransferase n=1 Tax=Sphingobacterium multivorum TaxID=28454 RepID=UPI00289E158D|nr:glycosyltransferase [Sphingobacterium multivorum]